MLKLYFCYNTGCIKTGCQSSPAYKSRFCAEHTSFTCDPGHSLTHEPDEKSEVEQSSNIHCQNGGGEAIIHMLLERKCIYMLSDLLQGLCYHQ